MKKVTFEVGYLYKIRFHDHSVGCDEDIICEAVGWCMEQSDVSAKFTYWLIDSDCQETVNNNVEVFKVVKSAIISKRKIG